MSLLSVQSGNSKFMMIYLEKLCCIQKDASCEKSDLTLADEKLFEEAFVTFFLMTITDLIYCAYSLRKHPTFHYATSGFRSKWCLRNVSAEIPYQQCVNTTLMIQALVTHHQLKICFIQSGKWRLINVEFLCSFLRHLFCGESAGDIIKCWLFSQAIVP